MRPRWLVRVSAWRPIALVVGLGVATGLLTLGLVAVAHHQRVQAERRDPSFRYGQQVMLTTVYPHLQGSVRDACGAAMTAPSSPPSNLSRQKAVDGCVYEEQQLDN